MINGEKIDMMTEKWMVASSVEVLLRFPLKPGEDPRARCEPNQRRKPSVNQPHTASLTPGPQRERKSINQGVRMTNQRPTDVTKKVDRDRPQQSQRPTKVLNLKTRHCGPVKERSPPSDDIAAQVRCKNCGAWGHKMSSRKCPMKNWDLALPLQPLGSSEEKENLEPRRLQGTHSEKSFKEMNRHTELGRRPEHQEMKTTTQIKPRKAQSMQQTHYKDLRESCGYIRQSALFTTTTTNTPDACSHDVPQSLNKAHQLKRIFPFQAQNNCPAVAPSRQPATHRLNKNTELSLQAPRKRLLHVPTETCKNPTKKTRLELPEAPAVISMAPALRPDKSSHLNAVQTGAVRPSPRSSRVPHLSVLTPFNRAPQSSRSTAAPASVSSKKPAPRVPSPQGRLDSQKPCAHPPRSVLYEDLFVSSSESDGE
ncbi:protein FAM90A24-like [Tenrec ecaudatus]|uniref:protein FAM90A24-like n=1 Tax=Tenrec ecaudatus TaxID=94439 RepID=UPI003F591494